MAASSDLSDRERKGTIQRRCTIYSHLQRRDSTLTPNDYRTPWPAVSRRHEQIGDPTIADGILDRLVHNAHRIEMRGKSMRKKRNPPRDESNEKKG